MGNRFGGLKQVEAVGPGGETILDYSVYDAVRAGFGRVVFVIREEMRDVFEREVVARFRNRVDIAYAVQRQEDLPEGFTVPDGRVKPWGTGHAVLATRDVVDGFFSVINADDFYGAQAFRILADFYSGQRVGEVPEYVMVAFVLRNTLSQNGAVSRGICEVDGDGLLLAVDEFTNISPDGRGAVHHGESGARTVFSGGEPVSLNCWGLDTRVFPHLEMGFKDFLETADGLERGEFYLPAALGKMVSEGQAKIRVLPSVDAWFGVTYKEDKEMVAGEVARLVQSGIYPARLWS